MIDIFADLKFDDKQWTVGPFEYENDEGIHYHWTDGNYSCDCNRELFISGVDPTFEFPYMRKDAGYEDVMECGDRIQLLKLYDDTGYIYYAV